jgi:hypothetical protein
MSLATVSVILGSSPSFGSLSAKGRQGGGAPGDPFVNRSIPQAEGWIPGTAQKRGPRMTVLGATSPATHSVSSRDLSPGPIGPQTPAVKWIAETRPAMTTERVAQTTRGGNHPC